MTRIRSSLTSMQPYSGLNDEEIRQRKKAAWHGLNLALINPEKDIMDAILRQQLINHMDMLYGKRPVNPKKGGANNG